MKNWIEQKWTAYIKELLKNNSGLQGTDIACQVCHRGREIWRCMDCADHRLTCAFCYQVAGLWQVGVKIFTGHDGLSCGLRSEYKDYDRDIKVQTEITVNQYSIFVIQCLFIDLHIQGEFMVNGRGRDDSTASCNRHHNFRPRTFRNWSSVWWTSSCPNYIQAILPRTVKVICFWPLLIQTGIIFCLWFGVCVLLIWRIGIYRCSVCAYPAKLLCHLHCWNIKGWTIWNAKPVYTSTTRNCGGWYATTVRTPPRIGMLSSDKSPINGETWNIAYGFKCGRKERWKWEKWVCFVQHVLSQE